MLAAVALGALGLILIESAFSTPPDPRLVLASMFGGQSGQGSSSSVPANPDFQYQGTMPLTQVVQDYVDARRNQTIMPGGTATAGGGRVVTQ